MTTKPIIADRDAFELGRSGRKRNFWDYTTTHTLRQMLVPGYFQSVAELFGVRNGDRVDCIVGSPTEGLEVRCAFDWPQRLEPICVAIVWKHRATPCRHDGGKVEEAA